MTTGKNQRKAIEESFPIVEINRLAIPERNAFKPIYQMHKWFARRASCVFRAILLGAMKPAGLDIMTEFYKDHTKDRDTNGVQVLDPFMGGGTTIVEALRLGCKVTGIDLNPVAWFIVKTEVEPVEMDELKAAFKRLEHRKTASGNSVRETLLSHYRTECPCCGAGHEEADIIYTFWVKSAICTDPNCRREVPLFSNYIVSAKTPSLRYIPDYSCSACKKTFDLELDRSSLVAELSLMVSNPKDSAGDKRGNRRWAAFDEVSHSVRCPWCSKQNKLIHLVSSTKAKKKISLNVLLCPHCMAIWQYRGTLPEDVTCPVCTKTYKPETGNIPDKGSFLCPSCGNRDKIINSIHKLPETQLLPASPYAIEGYCPNCDAGNGDTDIFGDKKASKKNVSHTCNIHHHNGKFFKRVTPADLKRYQDAEAIWEKAKSYLPYPKGKIPVGEKTKSGLIAHHFNYWHQMFNPRQLLCLSTLLKAIDEEKDGELKEMLLSAFYSTLESNNIFCRYTIGGGNKSQGIFSRHDYQPKLTFTENNPWGSSYGHSTYTNNFEKVIAGKEFCYAPFDRKSDQGKLISEKRDEIVERSDDTLILCGDSTSLPTLKCELVITDPPYAGNVNYSELADFFYVWLRLLLGEKYPHFSPEITPKTDEIIENPTRGKSPEDYKVGLTEVWRRCHENLVDDGLLVFTFHHAEGSTWETLLDSLCNAGFMIEAIYPIQGESETSLHLMDKQSISYDLIHVCKKRNGGEGTKQRSWAGVRQEIRTKAREEIKKVEAGRYGTEKIGAGDANIILIGKCLELYSRHYGKVVDYKNDAVPLQDALTSIRMMVEQIVTTQRPLPSELEAIDPVSYVYLTCLCDRKEIKSDEVHKTTRGLMEPETLIKAGVMRKGRAKRGRTYEVKTPDERFKDLQKLFSPKPKDISQLFLFADMEEAKFERVSLVDILHFLMGLAEAGENLVPWLKEFGKVTPQIRVAYEYLREKNPTFQGPIKKILNLVEV